ncbi:phytosulfokines 3-like [Cornus florida]|uniref:phytosulfokines 3-like n=1 Tax=Cornus florida TaxID=4283 RepID=UPI0028972BFB|nr:phytosulfokines 3-like [Cornus florida]
MSKFSTLFVVVLLLSFTLSYSARPEPVFHSDTLVNAQHEIEAQQVEVVDESCDGVGEEECLTRRTLAAHTDYIYTQKQKP